jgi:hypothetical protein
LDDQALAAQHDRRVRQVDDRVDGVAVVERREDAGLNRRIAAIHQPVRPIEGREEMSSTGARA